MRSIQHTVSQHSIRRKITSPGVNSKVWYQSFETTRSRPKSTSAHQDANWIASSVSIGGGMGRTKGDGLSAGFVELLTKVWKGQKLRVELLSHDRLYVAIVWKKNGL